MTNRWLSSAMREATMTQEIRRLTTCVVTLGTVLMLWPACASAQIADTLKDLEGRLEQGDTVYVTDRAGRESRGTLLGLTPSSLTLLVEGQQRQWLEADLREIGQRRGDPLRNGMWLGGGIGTAAGLALGLWCASKVEEGSGVVLCPPFYAGVGAGIGLGVGAAIDAAIRKVTTVFRGRPNALGLNFTPVVTNDAKGVRVAWRF